MMFTGSQMFGMFLAAFNLPLLIAFYIIDYIGGKSIIGKIAPMGSIIGFICGLVLILFGGK